MTDHVLVEMTIAAPADAVWDALRDPAKILNWHGWDDPSLKEEVEFIYVTHAKADDATHVLSWEDMSDRFEVIDRGETSILRIVRSLPEGESWDDVYQDMVEGWISFVQQLRLSIEQHDLAPRRTIYLDGAAVEGSGPPSAALGLTDILDTPPGAPVAVTLPTGDNIEGTAWHRTTHQFGVTVPEWGNGLLIVTDKSITDTARHGRGMVILTTYGLSDADFTALESRWTNWWGEHFTKGNAAACT